MEQALEFIKQESAEVIRLFEPRQQERAYSKMYNDILEAIMGPNLDKSEIQVLLSIYRRTIGYHVDNARIALSQISADTGIHKSNVSRAINSLISRNILQKNVDLLGINLDVSSWGCEFNNSEVVKSTTVVESTTPERVVKSTTTGLLNLQPIKKYINKNNTPYIPLNDEEQKPAQQAESAEPAEPVAVDEPAAEPKPARRKRASVTLKTFLEQCKAEGVKPIPEGHAVFAYAERVGLPIEMVGLAWHVFKQRYLQNNKRYIDWAAHFKNAVESDWFHLWAFSNADGTAYLTTAGKQVQRDLDSARSQR